MPRVRLAAGPGAPLPKPTPAPKIRARRAARVVPARPPDARGFRVWMTSRASVEGSSPRRARSASTMSHAFADASVGPLRLIQTHRAASHIQMLCLICEVRTGKDCLTLLPMIARPIQIFGGEARQRRRMSSACLSVVQIIRTVGDDRNSLRHPGQLACRDSMGLRRPGSQDSGSCLHREETRPVKIRACSSRLPEFLWSWFADWSCSFCGLCPTSLSQVDGRCEVTSCAPTHYYEWQSYQCRTRLHIACAMRCGAVRCDVSCLASRVSCRVIGVTSRHATSRHVMQC